MTDPIHPGAAVRTRALVRARASIPVLLALVAACGGQAVPTSGPAPAAAPAVRPATAVSPMDLGGQKVLILPVQTVSGIPQSREEATREVVFALQERDQRTQWVEPDRLRSALHRSPGYADDPDILPSDAFRHHQERYVVEPLGGLLRRYSALMDTRLAFIPQSAQWLPAPGGAAGGVVRLSAVMIDTRSSNVVWYGEADGQTRPEPDAAALGTAAAALAARMLITH